MDEIDLEIHVGILMDYDRVFLKIMEEIPHRKRMLVINEVMNVEWVAKLLLDNGFHLTQISSNEHNGDLVARPSSRLSTVTQFYEHTLSVNNTEILITNVPCNTVRIRDRIEFDAVYFVNCSCVDIQNQTSEICRDGMPLRWCLYTMSFNATPESNAIVNVLSPKGLLNKKVFYYPAKLGETEDVGDDEICRKCPYVNIKGDIDTGNYVSYEYIAEYSLFRKDEYRGSPIGRQCRRKIRDAADNGKWKLIVDKDYCPYFAEHCMCVLNK